MNYKNLKDEAKTEQWLKENGLNSVLLTTIQIASAVLQARMIATNIIKQHGRLLSHTEVCVLNKFLQESSSKKMCGKITTNMCFKVMNIATQVNRKVFKAHKKLNKTSL
jgi:hypothetical protein